MNTNKHVKTYKNWLSSSANTLEDFLCIGDIVDKEFLEHFRNVLPPLYDNSRILQVGECSGFANGKNTYTTFAYNSEDSCWHYVGDCHRGETKRPYTIVKSIKNYDIVKLFANETKDGCYGDIDTCADALSLYHQGDNILQGYGIFSKDGYCVSESADWYYTIESAEQDINKLQ